MNATYNTSDLPQATFLYASDIPLIGVERIDTNRSEFCFERTEGIEELLIAFASGRKIPIAPANLLASHKHLKSLLWSNR